MTALPEPTAIDEVEGVDLAQFHGEIRPAGKPVVMRGLVSDWRAVAAAREGPDAMISYLDACGTTRPVCAIMAPPDAQGRFFYNDQMTGLNFQKWETSLTAFLARLQELTEDSPQPAMAVQSETIADLLPKLAAENRLDLLPTVNARIWIGNRIRVAPHFDLMENVACNVAGKRRFTLFPPDALPHLYPGPFELTPAGTPISMVDMAEPDLARFPDYPKAWAKAVRATLEPGDALYIPFGWWHGVESLEPLSILVNYWWAEAPEGVGGGYDALLHAMLSYRHLPDEQRAFWKMMIGHYVFEADGEPGAHLPQHARGIMAPRSPQLFARMRALLKQAIR